MKTKKWLLGRNENGCKMPDMMKIKAHFFAVGAACGNKDKYIEKKGYIVKPILN
jgi:hypothetical protein